MTNEEPTDKQLIDSYLSGERDSLTVLVRRWHVVFCQKAYWVLKDKELAKDVAQDCWVLISKKLDTLKNRDSFRSWALRIVYSKSIDVYNKSKSRTAEEEQWKRQKTQTKEVLSNNNQELKRALREAIRQLSKEQQDVVRLFYTENYSVAEIGTVLDIPPGTVKSRLYKAREKLKLIIKSNRNGQ